MIFKADDFMSDPYSYVTNQLSHALFVGAVMLALGGCLLYFWLAGEYPYRWQVATWIGAAYLAYELIDQGWCGWDTIEDWFFVNIGSCGALYTFHEVEAGSTQVTGDLLDSLPFIGAMLFVLACGAVRRWWISLGKIGG